MKLREDETGGEASSYPFSFAVYKLYFFSQFFKNLLLLLHFFLSVPENLAHSLLAVSVKNSASSHLGVEQCMQKCFQIHFRLTDSRHLWNHLDVILVKTLTYLLHTLLKLTVMRKNVYILRAEGKRSVSEEVARLLGLDSPRREDCGGDMLGFFFFFLTKLKLQFKFLWLLVPFGWTCL